MFNIREALESDIPFIFNSWVGFSRAMCKSKQKFARISADVYAAHYNELVRQILIRSQCLVACNKQDPTQIYGYVVFENLPDANVIHMTYIKETFRNMNIAQDLWEKSIDPLKRIFHTEDSYLFLKFKHKDKVIYNPFLMWDKIRSYKHDAIRAGNA